MAGAGALRWVGLEEARRERRAELVVGSIVDTWPRKPDSHRKQHMDLDRRNTGRIVRCNRWGFRRRGRRGRQGLLGELE